MEGIMNTPCRLYRSLILYIASLLPLITCAAGSGIPRQASLPAASTPVGLTLSVSSDPDGTQGREGATCSAFLPVDAKLANSFQLCQSDHTGKNELYACQDFVSASGRFRIFFKGGHHPKAITTLAENGEVTKFLWPGLKQVDTPVCNFPAPPQIPSATSFLGAGVCEDEAGQPIPCTAFRHRAARLETISDYLVFYRKDGTGPESVVSIDIGANPDAEPAELAYQLGLSLLKTSCCQQRGLEYIERAYRLFPESKVYRTAYKYFSQQK